ncbi:hypothetical protein [Desulfosarcina ovata]|nr:hypothetical protein [Desulfosarcina ovata]
MKKGSPQCYGTAESALALPQGGNENPDLISSKDGPFLRNCKFLLGAGLGCPWSKSVP